LLLSVFFVVIARPVDWLLYPATVVAIAGIGVRLWASGFIVKNEQLATNGPYAFVRHPLYVGNILILFAFAAASGLWWAFLIVIAFLWFYYPKAIEYEDRKLRSIFPGTWQEFANQTPALMPRLGGHKRNFGGKWSFRKSLTANLEPVIAVFLLACFFYIYSRL
jgi:protein-S-isoprenylcysteine O-methyltransferase Ste14